MRVAAIQSCFIPWRGYFDFIDSVDLFVFYDDVQFSKNSWRNRNKVKTPKGTEWMTVPVCHEKLSQLIENTKIHHGIPWQKTHMGTWSANYKAAPYFDHVLGLLSDLDVVKDGSISNLNIRLIRRICAYLGITTPMILSSELSLVGSKTDRLIDLLTKVKGTTYLSGPSADAYLDKELFRRNGISLEYKSYAYEPYPQLWGPFEGGVTVLDLIANCGKEACKKIQSLVPNKIIVG